MVPLCHRMEDDLPRSSFDFSKKYSKNQTGAKTTGEIYKTFNKWVWIITTTLVDCKNEFGNWCTYYCYLQPS